MREIVSSPSSSGPVAEKSAVPASPKSSLGLGRVIDQR